MALGVDERRGPSTIESADSQRAMTATYGIETGSRLPQCGGKTGGAVGYHGRWNVQTA